MPVESLDLETAATRYAVTLAEIAGSPPAFDLVHLGLGPDGHTASLVPGDPVLEVTDADVALTGVYQGRRRMTLTYPILNRSRRILWLVTGSEKAGMLIRLRDGDPSIPAGRVRQDGALVLSRGDVTTSRHRYLCRFLAGYFGHGGILVTGNVREFRKVPGLKMENWLAALD